MSEATSLKFKISRRVTLPLFKIASGTTLYIKSEGAMYLGKEVTASRNAGATEKKKEPATIMNVVNLETGEQGQIICGAVLKGIFNDEYPDEAYVGLAFMIEMHKVPGKDYNGYTVTEIEVESEAEQTADVTPIKAAGGKKGR